MVRSAVGCLAGVLLVANASVSAQEPVRLYAAGSLRAAMTEIAGAFEKLLMTSPHGGAARPARPTGAAAETAAARPVTAS